MLEATKAWIENNKIGDSIIATPNKISFKMASRETWLHSISVDMIWYTTVDSVYSERGYSEYMVIVIRGFSAPIVNL
jgi:hypothetical protein